MTACLGDEPCQRAGRFRERTFELMATKHPG